MAHTHVLLIGDEPQLLDLIANAIFSERNIVVGRITSSEKEALPYIDLRAPDVAVISFERQPARNLRVLGKIRDAYPSLPVVLFSALPEATRAHPDPMSDLIQSIRARKRAPNALAPDKNDPVGKAQAKVLRDLVPRIRVFCAPKPTDRGRGKKSSPKGLDTDSLRLKQPIEMLLIGVSTGGPKALHSLLAELPGDFPVPIVIVQHMPSHFMQAFTKQLDASCSLRVTVAEDGVAPVPGEVWLAPGDRHLQIQMKAGDPILRITKGAPENSCRPSVDVLFRSGAAALGRGILAVVLTGMGTDGLTGCAAIRAAGGKILVQDKESSVVWGMPGAVAGAGLADAVYKLSNLPEAIIGEIERVESETAESDREPVGQKPSSRRAQR